MNNKLMAKSKLTLEDVQAYLKQNPSIFQDHPELLELISLSDNRGTASLLERQVTLMKDRLGAHQDQQSQFIQVVRENEEISDNFTDLICRMISFTNLSQFATEFPRELRSKFKIDEVTFKTALSAARKPSDEDAYKDTMQRLPSKRSLCDNRWPNNIMNLFFSKDINSAAIIPMRDNDDNILGLLALGSQNPERYTHDLGTAHLDRLGLMSGLCLNRLQPSSV